MVADNKYPPGVARGINYAWAVVGGDISACELAKLAAQRFLNDLSDAESGGMWSFNPQAAENAIHFASQMPNIKGPEAGKPLRLMDWQCFVFANLFGFMEPGSNTRRFRQSVVFTPRGNGKTSVSAPIALYLTFMDGEGGAEGYAAAVTRDQARILFDVAQEMVRRSPEFRQRRNVQVGANSIFCSPTASKFVPVSSDAKALDGLNLQVAVCDEISSHRTSEVYDVLLTAMGKRRQPMLLCISTATGNTTGIGKQLWDYSVKILRGQQQGERLFALLYTIDEGDDPWDESTWIKANPSWGQAVQPTAIRDIMRQARNNPAQEAVAKTRHLNIWVGADQALFSFQRWLENADGRLNLADFEDKQCYIGIDLAAKTDLAAVVLVFPESTEGSNLTYTVFSRFYLNQAAVDEARNASYPGWAHDEFLNVTPGNETDFTTIEDDLREFCSRFSVQQIAYDPWASTQLAQRLSLEGAPMIEFRANTQNFSEPTKELDAAIRSGRLVHDGNPVLGWNISNVVGHEDARANVYPRKFRKDLKIDGAIALIMAIGVATRNADGPSVYESRGFLII